jgi:WD40 repeat protein
MPRAAPRSGTLKGHTDSVWSAAFSPDGKRLVTLDGHTRNVYSAGFSPDGTCVVTASGRHHLLGRHGAAVAGAPLATLEGHASSVLSARFSPDGQRVVTASGDRTARLWQVWRLLSDDTAAYTSIAAMAA